VWEHKVVNAFWAEHLSPNEVKDWTVSLKDPTPESVVSTMTMWPKQPMNCLIGWDRIMKHLSKQGWELVSVVLDRWATPFAKPEITTAWEKWGTTVPMSLLLFLKRSLPS
jgi:hypothetical protein